MHRLAVAFAGFAALAASACLKEKVQYCDNGAYCPEPLVCTERASAPFCGEAVEVGECRGKADEDPCTLAGAQPGYCDNGLCTACNASLAVCEYAEWTPMPIVIDGAPLSPSTPLKAVRAVGPRDVYVVGTGLLLHWDGVTWTRVAGATTDAQHNSIWGRTGGPIYSTVLNGASMAHIHSYDGQAWTAELPDSGYNTNAIWGGTTHVFAAGGASNLGQISHYDGATWTHTSEGTTVPLNGVWATDDDHAIVVGNGGVVRRYDSGTWSPESTGTSYPLLDVSGAGDSEFAVGRSGSGAGATAVVLRHQAGAWTDMTAMVPAGISELDGVWAGSPTEVYAVGRPGAILYFDGTSWVEHPRAAVDLEEIDGTGTDVFAVGAGTVLRRSR